MVKRLVEQEAALTSVYIVAMLGKTDLHRVASFLDPHLAFILAGPDPPYTLPAET